MKTRATANIAKLVERALTMLASVNSARNPTRSVRRSPRPAITGVRGATIAASTPVMVSDIPASPVFTRRSAAIDGRSPTGIISAVTTVNVDSATASTGAHRKTGTGDGVEGAAGSIR
ncbi:hypothetical protein HNR14_001141 [Leifsonia naganoensis]|uniref:Uncharacterized protein n=1 Tax=Leifsonia naganoensis TaxID=150025 RepID=A0A853DT71_9MICO|nr:hypothetical protein [Leifsonia naganoensis]NYK09260.1 hypothetical protein [Leifsonia naganoensis]